jgi:hypothetical protein
MRIIGNAGKAREVQAVASGALSTGDTVIVNSDGTVSVVAGSASQIGSVNTFTSNAASWVSSTIDTNANRIVIAYRDDNNSTYGTAVVGTIDASNLSISFGTPVVFNSARADYINAVFDSSNNKVVMVYKDVGSNIGQAIVGTVNSSNNSISFGSETTFIGNDSYYYGATFDSNSNKVVVAYNDYSNSEKGTAKVGTVSGTSISFGSATVFELGVTNALSGIGAAFDANLNKVVFCYSDGGNSNYGTAIVGTVSGTSISFGTAAVFATYSVSRLSADYDGTSQKVVIADNTGKAVVGTVSGTGISFGTAATFGTGASYTRCVAGGGFVLVGYPNSGNSGYLTSAQGVVSGTSITFEDPVALSSIAATYVAGSYSSSSERFVFSFHSGAYPSDTGQYVVSQAGSTNLTSENYIGTAASGTPDGKAAKINIKGAVDENQSGLTAGQSYYVQPDGSLGTTAGDPSVFAGTAVAATKLIVKG